MMKPRFAQSCFWHCKWELGFMYQIPTIRAVHILSADTNNPRGPVAKQVTMCFKSLPDGSFSKSQMKNSVGVGVGVLDFLQNPILIRRRDKACLLQQRRTVIYW